MFAAYLAFAVLVAWAGAYLSYWRDRRERRRELRVRFDGLLARSQEVRERFEQHWDEERIRADLLRQVAAAPPRRAEAP